MTKFFDSAARRLVFTGEPAGPEFWDRHWAESLSVERIRRTGDTFVVGQTRRHLKEGARILEGGCGIGDKVHVLHAGGYEAYGIDNAAASVRETNRLAPELNVSCGDVEHLPFGDGFFDGYWSLGVIEHFREGFQATAREMHRVLRPGGFLFLTVPAFSPLRRFKSRLGLYPDLGGHEGWENTFYQFAYDPAYVRRRFEAAGFHKLESRLYDGVKGLKDEVPLFRPLLQPLYDNVEKSRWAGISCAVIDRLTRFLTGHMAFFVFQKPRAPGA